MSEVLTQLSGDRGWSGGSRRAESGLGPVMGRARARVGGGWVERRDGDRDRRHGRVGAVRWWRRG
jgi:hypothetical protein